MGVLYSRALGMQVLKMRGAKKKSGFKAPCGAWLNEMPLDASSIPDRYMAGPVLKWEPRERCEEPLQML